MQLRQVTLGVLVAVAAVAPAAGTGRRSAIAAAAKAMGVDTLTSITYSGTARNGAFGQSKAIGEPMGPVNVTLITQYTRTINFGQPTDPGGAGLPRDRSDAAAHRPGRAAAAAGRLQSEHHRHAGRHQLDAGAQHLDDAVGIPEGSGGQRRPPCGGRAASRSCRSRRRTSSRRQGRPTR